MAELITIRTIEQLKKCIKEISSKELIAFDTETTGLNTRKDIVVGFSVSPDKNKGWYLPIWEYDVLSKSLKPWKIEGIKDTKRLAIEILQRVLLKKKLIMHNGIFDILMCKHDLETDLSEAFYADTIMMAHTVNERGYTSRGKTGFGLKLIGVALQEQLGIDVSKTADAEQIEMRRSVKANGGTATAENTEVYKADMDILGKYAAQDTCLTYALFDYFTPKLEEENLEKLFYEDEVMPLLKEVTMGMTERGMDVDLELLKKTENEILSDMEKYRNMIMEEILGSEYGKFYVCCKALNAFPVSSKGKWMSKAKELYGVNEELANQLSLFATDPEEEIKTNKTSPKWYKDFVKTGDSSFVPVQEAIKISRELWKKSNDGQYFNIQSVQQWKEFVFGEFSVPKILEKYNIYIADTKAKKPLDRIKKTHPYRKEISKYFKDLTHKKSAFDDDTIKSLKSSGIEWAENLRVYRKLQKIYTTYIKRFLYESENGKFYFYWKQHGTVSGRYASDAQQLPRPMEDGVDTELVMKYNRIVRKFIIAGKGYKFIDADYESLEPHCFAFVAGDKKLMDIFNKGEDFYSAVAIATEKLDQDKKTFPDGVSADKKSAIYLKKIAPIKRRLAKGYSLGIPYGMEAYALGMTIDVSTAEAEKLIDGYFLGFPELENWFYQSRETFYNTGTIKNYFGRTGHLYKAQEEFNKYGAVSKTIRGKERRICRLMDSESWASMLRKIDRRDIAAKEALIHDRIVFKKGNNDCLNFQIQSLGAGIVNRAAIAINRYIKEHNIDGQVVMQVHDQIVTRVREDQAEELRKAVETIMEETTKLEGITLKAPAEIANNLAEGH